MTAARHFPMRSGAAEVKAAVSDYLAKSGDSSLTAVISGRL